MHLWTRRQVASGPFVQAQAAGKNADMKSLVFRLVLALAVALVAAAVSAKSQLSDLPLVVELEQRIVFGEDIAVKGVVLTTTYNRVLFPLLYVQAARLLPGFDPGHLFVALRFSSIFVCFALMFASIDRRASQAHVDPVATFLAVGFAYTATVIRHPMPHTSDIFDLALMFYVYLDIMEGLTGLAFAGVGYFFLRAGNERPVRLLANSALLTVVPYALAIVVRRHFYRGELPATSMGQFLTGLPANVETMLTDIVRLNPWNDFYLLVAIALGSLMFGLVREIRIFMPCLSLLAAAAVADLGATERRRPVSSA
jgi:hypothetical protein